MNLIFTITAFLGIICFTLAFVVAPTILWTSVICGLLMTLLSVGMLYVRSCGNS